MKMVMSDRRTTIREVDDERFGYETHDRKNCIINVEVWTETAGIGGCSEVSKWSDTIYKYWKKNYVVIIRI